MRRNYKRRTNRPKRTRAPRRRAAPRRRKTRMYRPVGIRGSQMVKLRYTADLYSNVLPANTQSQIFRLNSLFDPDFSSSTTLQPYYYDQYCVMYRKYRVFGAKVTWRTNITSSKNDMFTPTLCMAANNGGVSWLTPEQAAAYQGAMYRRPMPNTSTVTMSKYYNIAKVCGVSKSEVATDDKYAASITATPNVEPVVYLYFKNNDGATPMAVSTQVTITYYAKFYEPQVPPGSF